MTNESLAATRRMLLYASGLWLAACASTAAPRRGELVIVGGGLRTNNAEVYGAFLDGAGDRIVVLPTASGVPESSGPGVAEDLVVHAAAEQAVDVIAIHADTPERAFDRDYVGHVADADAVWFTGGVQSRILAVFRPGGVDTPAYRGVREVLNRGGRVAGSSAGAAMMSDPMIAWGNSREALLVGVRDDIEDRALKTEQGMGFFPYGLVDQHFMSRGRVGRLIVALDHTGQALGYGIADNRALAVDLSNGRGRALGDRAVIVLDAGSARRDGFSRRGVRVSLASHGDELDLEHGTLFPDPEKVAVAKVPGALWADYGPLLPWGRDTLTILLERLSDDPRRNQSAAGETFVMVVRADERTRFLARGTALADFTVVNAILDIEALEGASQAATELKREYAAAGPRR